MKTKFLDAILVSTFFMTSWAVDLGENGLRTTGVIKVFLNGKEV